jgi:dienelactone hydrolase
MSTSTGSDERPAFCENCLKGFSWEGTPTGTSRKMGAFDVVYVARAPGVDAANGTPAVLLLTDIFGFSVCTRLSARRWANADGAQIPNPKLLADALAAGSGLTVYVPDVFYGESILSSLIFSHR